MRRLLSTSYAPAVWLGVSALLGPTGAGAQQRPAAAVEASVFVPLNNGQAWDRGLPSGRVVLELEAGPGALHAGALRLLSTQTGFDGAVVGGSLRLGHGPLAVRPFGELSLGRMWGVVDSGGYHYIDPVTGSIEYQARRRSVTGASVGAGVGITAGWVVASGLEAQVGGGLWVNTGRAGVSPHGPLRLSGGLRWVMPRRAHAEIDFADVAKAPVLEPEPDSPEPAAVLGRRQP
jgi:hypothetical protein